MEKKCYTNKIIFNKTRMRPAFDFNLFDRRLVYKEGEPERPPASTGKGEVWKPTSPEAWENLRTNLTQLRQTVEKKKGGDEKEDWKDKKERAWKKLDKKMKDFSEENRATVSLAFNAAYNPEIRGVMGKYFEASGLDPKKPDTWLEIDSELSREKNLDGKNNPHYSAAYDELRKKELKIAPEEGESDMGEGTPLEVGVRMSERETPTEEGATAVAVGEADNDMPASLVQNEEEEDKGVKLTIEEPAIPSRETTKDLNDALAGLAEDPNLKNESPGAWWILQASRMGNFSEKFDALKQEMPTDREELISYLEGKDREWGDDPMYVLTVPYAVNAKKPEDERFTSSQRKAAEHKLAELGVSEGGRFAFRQFSYYPSLTAQYGDAVMSAIKEGKPIKNIWEDLNKTLLNNSTYVSRFRAEEDKLTAVARAPLSPDEEGDG